MRDSVKCLHCGLNVHNSSGIVPLAIASSFLVCVCKTRGMVMMLWKTALAWKIRATKRWRTIIAKMMMLRISLLVLINVRMPNSFLFYIICSSGLRLAWKFFCVYLPIWMRSDLKRLVLCACVICLFWFFQNLFLKDYGLAIYIFACSLQINTFNSLKKKKPTFSWFLMEFTTVFLLYLGLIC